MNYNERNAKQFRHLVDIEFTRFLGTVSVGHTQHDEIRSLIEDALRWRALNCGRVRLLGSAGLTSEDGLDHYEKPYDGYAHIGLELWTRYTPIGESLDPKIEQASDANRASLLKYTDIGAALHFGSGIQRGAAAAALRNLQDFTAFILTPQMRDVSDKPYVYNPVPTTVKILGIEYEARVAATVTTLHGAVDRRTVPHIGPDMWRRLLLRCAIFAEACATVDMDDTEINRMFAMAVSNIATEYNRADADFSMQIEPQDLVRLPDHAEDENFALKA